MAKPRVPLTLPPCLLDGAKLLFPKLDFSRIYFYYQQGGTEPTTSAYLTRTEITFVGSGATWADTSEFKETFEILCHELVHALQKQGFWARIMGHAASWTCGLLHGSSKSDDGNCVEHEAYAYEQRLDKWMTDHNVTPCNFGSNFPAIAYPLRATVAAFADAVKTDPSIVKRTAGCTPWSCLDPGTFRWIIGNLISIPAFVWSIPTAFVDGTFGYIGAIGGGISGATAGAFAGIGVVVGPVIGGMIGLVPGAIIGALVGNVVHWLERLFGDEGGGLNLMFSADRGLTFNSKIGFERSCEPMSLSFGLEVERLAIAYTGTDNRVDLITVPSKSPLQPYGTQIAFQESGKCGPAVINEGFRLQVAWQGSDNHLNVNNTHDGVHFYSPVTTFKHWITPDNASPAMCEVASTLIIAFIDTSLGIQLGINNNAGGWNTSIPLNEHADSETTVAITATQGNGFAIAWVGAEKRKRINILNLTFNPTIKAVTRGAKYTLVERSNAGPALAVCENPGQHDGPFLYLAWTGFGQAINFMRSRDFGKTWEAKQSFEQSRPDCGPALAVHPESGLICVGWTGTK